MEASLSTLARFVDVLFRHVSPGGWILLRAFYEEKDQPWRPHQWRSLPTDDLQAVAQAAYQIATAAANDPEVAVFCPPVCTFKDPNSAGEHNVREGVVLLVDCDRYPKEASDKLVDLLGTPTLAVASGGVHEGIDKLHLYWRLRKPTITPEEHELLKRARAYGAKYAHTDPTSAPLSHPIRWAGTWHRKSTPRLAEILYESDHELDLHTAFQMLRNAVGAEDAEEFHGAAIDADPKDVESALQTIPNSNLDWDAWNDIGMAVFASTSGSEDGKKMWLAWSAQAQKDSPARTSERWEHWKRSPPTRTGAGKLYKLAIHHDPTWRRPGEEAPQFSDEFLALGFAGTRLHDLRYTAQWNKWYHWTGSYWREDRTLVSTNLAREFCRGLSRIANKAAKSIASARAVSNVLTLSRADQRIAAEPEQWNANPWLLGTPGGTVDLRNGIRLMNGASDYITRVVSVTPEGECPLWMATLAGIFGKDQEMMDYAQRIAGYFLTGSIREEKMFFLHGDGGNGKGTFIETLVYAMGDYSTTIAMNTLVMTQHSEHPTEIAKLCGARLAVASETNESARWNAARIKSLTGGDALTARFMRGDYFDFNPTHKLVVSSNRRPNLGRVDHATTRRVELIPFEITFTAPDRTIKERLRAEAPGILEWAIQGCLLWQRWGIRPPASVQKATEEYLHDQDDIQMFVDERCDIAPTVRTSSSVLYAEWQDWCQTTGTYVGSKKDFTQRMAVKFETKLVQNLTHFIGVRLAPKNDYSAHDDDRSRNDHWEPPF